MSGIENHKSECRCVVCKALRECSIRGKRTFFHFRTFPELAEKILEKSEQSGLSPQKWLEEHFEQTLISSVRMQKND